MPHGPGPRARAGRPGVNELVDSTVPAPWGPGHGRSGGMGGGRTGTPTWRRVFDRVERAVGEPLEAAVASQRFVDVMAAGLEVRRSATGAVRGVVNGVAGALLRTVDTATRDDVQRMNRSLVVPTSEVRLTGAERQAGAGRGQQPGPGSTTGAGHA